MNACFGGLNWGSNFFLWPSNKALHVCMLCKKEKIQKVAGRREREARFDIYIQTFCGHNNLSFSLFCFWVTRRCECLTNSLRWTCHFSKKSKSSIYACVTGDSNRSKILAALKSTLTCILVMHIIIISEYHFLIDMYHIGIMHINIILLLLWILVSKQG